MKPNPNTTQGEKIYLECTCKPEEREKSCPILHCKSEVNDYDHEWEPDFEGLQPTHDFSKTKDYVTGEAQCRFCDKWIKNYSLTRPFIISER